MVGEASRRLAKTFYSRMQRSLEKKMPNSASPDQVANIVNDPQNAAADEVKWSGIGDWLKEQKGKVTKQAVMDFLDQNNLQVGEVKKGALAQGGPITDEMYQVAQRRQEISDLEDKGDFVGASRLREIQAKFINASREKYAQYVLPGGQNYRELLLTKPTVKYAPVNYSTFAKARGYDDAKVAATFWDRSDPVFREWKNESDAAWSKSLPFGESHWDEPNVLAHVRFNDRTDKDGKKALHIEEVQSDWHQKGRERGYKTDPVDPMSYLEVGSVTDPDTGKPRPALFRKSDTLRNSWTAIASQRPGETRQQMIERGIQRTTQPDVEGKGAVPDAPFKKNWHELAMKRMLRYAAENGYDRVTWTTGDQQAKRYGQLLEGVKELRYDPYDGRVTALHSGAIKEISRGTKPEELPGVVGKEMAQRLLAAPMDKQERHTIQGPDITIGGEGMKGFYDKILPEFMNKYGKKWGAKAGEAQIPTDTYGIYGGRTVDGVRYWIRGSDGRNVNATTGRSGHDPVSVFKTEEEAKAARDKLQHQSVHSIDVTPEMKKSVLHEGQPIARATQPPPMPYTAAPPRQPMYA